MPKGEVPAKRKYRFRDDARVDHVEKVLEEDLGVPVTLRNSDGRDTRGDKLMKNYRKDQER